MTKADQYQATASRIFSEDFYLWLRENLALMTVDDQKKYEEVAKRVHEATAGRRMSECIMALSVFLPASIVDSGLDIDRLLKPITSFKEKQVIEGYIQ
jgi:hypothetical protein